MKPQAYLPLITYADPNSDAIATNATAVAKQLDLSLHAMAVNADIPQISSALSRVVLNVPEMIRNAEVTSSQHGERLLELTRDAAKSRNVEFTSEAITETPPLLAATASLHARYYDLTIAGWEAGNDTSRTTVETLVFGSGRPTIILPDTVTPQNFEHIAIAWDGSRVAARALADAHLFISKAKRVSVLTVVDEKRLARDIGETLASALEKRGIEAAAVPLRCEGKTVAEALQTSAIEREASLLVMGGYGHSRLRDFVLGGATEGVLKDVRLPILLAH